MTRRESTVLKGKRPPPRRGRPANPPVNAIGRMMVRRGWRPADLFSVTGISQRKMYNILNNRTFPTEMDLFEIARALDCKPDDIRERT